MKSKWQGSFLPKNNSHGAKFSFSVQKKGFSAKYPYLRKSEGKCRQIYTMIIILNPKYERLHDFVCNIEDHFRNEGTIIHDGRNTVKTIQVDGLTLCVKHYGTPKLRQRLAIKTYKTPKGKRAFMRPLQLRERGFESPEPVAYVSLRKGLTTNSTYFICLQSKYRHSMADWKSMEHGELDELLRNFARYTARLHERGFMHRDYSSDNILYDKVDGRFHFSLIDTNDMMCSHKVSIERGCKNLARLSGDEDFFDKLIRFYAEERGADPALCREYFDRAVRKPKAQQA